MASIILTAGMGIAAAHKLTGLDIKVLEKLVLRIEQEKSSSPKSNL